MDPRNSRDTGNQTLILWLISGALTMALIFARAVFPELLWATALIAILLVATLGYLVKTNHQSLRSRSAAYGINSIVTVVLVIGIICVLNFLASRYPAKADLTKNKLHTLSDQTVKLVKGIKNPVKAIYFDKAGGREKVRPLLDDLKALNTKFEVEYVDPDKEPARAKQVGIKKYGTLQLVAGTKESKIEDATEEKLTNALIKVLKEKSQTLCATTGHGEKNFSSPDTDGYDAAKKSLQSQSYEVRDLNLLQETKIPDSCDALAIIGPNKSFFPQEIKAIQDYLANGGRALVALDLNIKGSENSPELVALLQNWHVKPVTALIVDPLSKMLGVDASVPILTGYSKENAITRDFQASCYFPLSRPLEVVSGAPAGMNVQWLAQTSPQSWGETDLSQLASGRVEFNEGKDFKGPLNAAVAIDGKLKDSKATKNTRMVVFGTSAFATNNYSRFGGNLDFFMNAASWILEDESLISIRAKEEGPGKVELSQRGGTMIFFLTVIIVPLLVAVAGIVIWVIRRRL